MSEATDNTNYIGLTAEIDDLDTDPLGRQLIGDLESVEHGPAVADHGDVAAFTPNRRSPERNSVSGFGRWALHAVEAGTFDRHAADRAVAQRILHIDPIALAEQVGELLVRLLLCRPRRGSGQQVGLRGGGGAEQEDPARDDRTGVPQLTH